MRLLRRLVCLLLDHDDILSWDGVRATSARSTIGYYRDCRRCGRTRHIEGVL